MFDPGQTVTGIPNHLLSCVHTLVSLQGSNRAHGRNWYQTQFAVGGRG